MEDSDQPAHMLSLISLCCRHEETIGPELLAKTLFRLHACELICVLAGHTSYCMFCCAWFMYFAFCVQLSHVMRKLVSRLCDQVRLKPTSTHLKKLAQCQCLGNFRQSSNKCLYKNLSWLFGVDRKICPKSHCLASQDLLSDHEGQIFLPTQNSHDRFFLRIPFL